jgi:hypothetical protein
MNDKLIAFYSEIQNEGFGDFKHNINKGLREIKCDYVE